MTRPSDVPARPLNPGSPQRRTFDDDTPHAYEVEVPAQHLLRVTAEQLGVDVEARLFDPGGRQVMGMDSPTGDEGPETVSAVADEAGTYRVEIHPADHGEGADYEIRIDDLRPATGEDRAHVAAEQTFAAAEKQRREKKYADSGRLYKKALAAFRELGEGRGEAHALHRLGWLATSQNKHRQAAERLRLAAARFQELGEPKWVLACLNRLGASLRREGRPAEAAEVHLRARAIARDLDDPLLLADTLDLLGDGYRWTQRVEDALDAYRQALDLWSAMDGKEHKAAATWFRIGETYVGQDRLEDARDALERARDLAGDDQPALLSLVYSHLGNTAYRADRLDEARQHMEQALRLAEEMEAPHSRALAHSALGTLALRQERLDDGERHLRAALDLYRELRDSAMEGLMLHKLGRLRYAADDLDGALELHRRAAPLLERSEDRQGVASNRYAIARIHHDRGDHRQAREVLESTLRSADELRSDAELPDLQASYVDSKHHYWELYVDTLIHLEEAGHLGAADQALAVTESWRARGLVEMLEEAGVNMEQGVDERLLERRQKVQRKLNSVEMHSMEFVGTDEARRQRLERERLDLLRELRHVRSEIRRSGAVQRRLNPASDLAVLRSSAISDVQQSHLGTRTAILVYALGERRSVAWTVTQDEVGHHVLPPRDEVEELATGAAELLRSVAASNVERRRRVTEALADRVLAPLLEGLEEPRSYRRLIVVPDGALLNVPFAALPLPAGFGPEGAETEDGGRAPVLSHFEVVYLPSIATLLALRNTVEARRQSGRTASRAAAVIADPVFSRDDPRVTGADEPTSPAPPALHPLLRGADNGFSRLPATAREAEMIRRLMPDDARGSTLVAEGFEANREMVLSGHLDDYRILHFATHGVLDATHPELSGLVLSLVDHRGRQLDGILRLHEIYDLHLPAELVVLSACETGAGKTYRGEGVVGLTRGFMYAGAPRVVVSLWKVDDESTAELMWRFYHLLLNERQPPAAALRLAQRSMMGDPRWSQPHHWAGFVFLGDPVLVRALDNPIEKVETGADDQPPARADEELPIPDRPQIDLPEDE